MTVDADPTITTNPRNPDSDGDGINDGAEDTNQNGRLDPGELNPNNPPISCPTAAVPAGAVCTGDEPAPGALQGGGPARHSARAARAFTEVAHHHRGRQSRGLMGFDSTTNMAFVA